MSFADGLVVSLLAFTKTMKILFICVMLILPCGQFTCIYQDYDGALHLFMLCSDGLVVSLLAITTTMKIFCIYLCVYSDGLVASLLAFTKTRKILFIYLCYAQMA